MGPEARVKPSAHFGERPYRLGEGMGEMIRHTGGRRPSRLGGNREGARTVLAVLGVRGISLT